MRRWAAGLAVWAMLLLALAVAWARPAPLFVNLGAGDEPFARGFRDRWERDGLTGAGETMFRWTADGARLEVPVDVRQGTVEARLRVARFSDTPAEITVVDDRRIVAHWTQPPRGWRVVTLPLGEVKGPLRMRFRSEAPRGDPYGVALDWVEFRGVDAALPAPRTLALLALALLGLPLLVGLLFRAAAAGLLAAVVLGGLALAAVLLDRLGGLLAVAGAALPAVAVALVLAGAASLLRRLWPDVGDTRGALGVALAAAVLALLALHHPFFYYPDVDTHARLLAAIRADPWTAVDPSEFQARTGAWTRQIGGRRVAFPYSTVFHVLAWPAALALGEVSAVKTLAALAVGGTALLTFALARAVALPVAVATGAAALGATWPVTSSRLVLALYPTLLGQALDLFAVVHLARRLAVLDGARDAAAAAGVFLLALGAYTSSAGNLAALVAVLAALTFRAGETSRALRLLGAFGVAAGVVVVVLYARFLPVVWRDVLPHAGGAADGGGPLDAALGAASRLRRFFPDGVFVLLVPGLLALPAAATHARRVLHAVLLGGALLLLARYGLPALFRDAKEVELLAPALAVTTASALAAIARRRRRTALVVGVILAVLGVGEGVRAYADRFLAVGR